MGTERVSRFFPSFFPIFFFFVFLFLFILAGRFLPGHGGLRRGN